MNHIVVNGATVEITHTDKDGIAFDKEGNAYQEQSGVWKLIQKAQPVCCIGRMLGKAKPQTKRR